MAEVLDTNLSEVLFKPKHNYIETSLISNSGCPLPIQEKGFYLMGSHFRSLWYRPLNLYSWSYLGANNLDVEHALAKIVMAQAKRTRPECYDTIEQYGAGNWIYEFCAIAQQRVLNAREAEAKGDLIGASHQYRMASRYFAIAAFPNLKGDVLASQATLLGRKAYRGIFNNVKMYGHYSEECFTVRGEKVTAYLHSPSCTNLHPCVVVMCSYNGTSTDFYRLFSDYLRELGIAILVVDMPGIGGASSLSLTTNTAETLEAAVAHLYNIPFIDNTALAAMGYHLSANAVARFAITNPNVLKAIVLVSPSLHNAFVDQDLLNNMPLCTRSNLANRLDLDASSWDTIIPQLQILSLQKQGLLTYGTRSQVECLSIYMPADLKFNDDSRLIEQAFPHNSSIRFTKLRVSDFAQKAFTHVKGFLQNNLL